MHKLFLIFFMVVILNAGVNARENDFKFPEVIHEFENAMIIVNIKSPFTFEINQKCVGINVLSNIEKKNNSYILKGGSGYIEIDNKCFVNTEVTFTVTSGEKKIVKSYKLLPPIIEERNWGC